MKRSEFVDIINEVMREEEAYMEDRVKELQSKGNALPEIIAMSVTEMPGVAAQTVGKIIERAGLIHFDPFFVAHFFQFCYNCSIP